MFQNCAILFIMKQELVTYQAKGNEIPDFMPTANFAPMSKWSLNSTWIYFVS